LLKFPRDSSNIPPMTTRRFASLILCAFVAFFASTASADTTLGTPISKLPYTIKKPGKYRLMKNLTIADNLTIPGAISVTVPGVVIDLNGYTITGPTVSTTNLNGISASAEKVVIRNGTIYGFSRGVSAASHTTLEDMIFLEPTQAGFSLGNHSIARRCQVTLGFDTTGPAINAFGGLIGEYSELVDCIVRLNGASARPIYGLGIGSRCVVRNCTAIGVFPDPVSNSVGFFRNFGTEPSRIEGCTTFGFNYGFDGSGFNYDRCQAHEFVTAAKGNGASVTGNNF
jgi:hypothetical protein